MNIPLFTGYLTGFRQAIHPLNTQLPMQYGQCRYPCSPGHVFGSSMCQIIPPACLSCTIVRRQGVRCVYVSSIPPWPLIADTLLGYFWCIQNDGWTAIHCRHSQQVRHTTNLSPPQITTFIFQFPTFQNIWGGGSLAAGLGFWEKVCVFHTRFALILHIMLSFRLTGRWRA